MHQPVRPVLGFADVDERAIGQPVERRAFAMVPEAVRAVGVENRTDPRVNGRKTAPTCPCRAAALAALPVVTEGCGCCNGRGQTFAWR